MDVGRLMRAVLGEPLPAEGKILELKPGQVVRGIVLQLLAENEALLSLGGVPIRARLDTPIPPGRATLFQVQPESGPSLVLLKSFASSTADIPSESIADVLRTFGMKDTPLHREVVRVLHEEGVPMSRETNAAVSAAVKELAPKGGAEEWLRAAATAVKRGVPVTPDSVRALHTAMAGPTPSELFRALEKAAREALASPPASERVQQAATRLLEVLQRAETLLSEALRLPEAAPQAPGARIAAPAPAPAPQPQAALQPASAPPTDAAEPAAPPQEARPPLLAFLKLLGADAEREWLKLAGTQPPTQSGEPPEAAQARGPADRAPAPETGDRADRMDRADRGTDRILRNGPAELLRALPQTNADAPDQPEPQPQAQPQADRAPLETLKSALAQLTSGDDVPPALKEAAQTALQSVTGQQLLITQDRTAPFAHVTLFIPLRGKEGDGDAAVHIHARKGGKGQLDAENCRLWFQLTLASLGETWVDVAVTNKIVGLHIWNDHPASLVLMESFKTEIETGLKEAGYQLLTFRHSPKPKEPVPENGTAGSGPEHRKQLSAVYAPAPYKGVDLRI